MSSHARIRTHSLSLCLSLALLACGGKLAHSSSADPPSGDGTGADVDSGATTTDVDSGAGGTAPGQDAGRAGNDGGAAGGGTDSGTGGDTDSGTLGSGANDDCTGTQSMGLMESYASACTQNMGIYNWGSCASGNGDCTAIGKMNPQLPGPLCCFTPTPPSNCGGAGPSCLPK